MSRLSSGPNERAARFSDSPGGLFALVLTLLVLAPVSTKFAGLLFFVFLGWALWVGLHRQVAIFHFPTLHLWLFMTAFALILRGIATVFWSDSWGSRHFEGRLFLMSLAAWYLLPRIGLGLRQRTLLTHALALSCWSALTVVWVVGRDLSTNAIPWAAGISFIVCVLLGRLYDASASLHERSFWILSVFAGLAAVLVSQTRGSFILVFWVLGLLSVGLGVWIFTAERGRIGLWRFVLVLTTASFVALTAPRVVQGPAERVGVAVREATQLIDAMSYQHVSPQVLDTSVGARLYLWARVADPLGANALWGVGQKQREEWIVQVGRDSGSAAIASFNHLHSDPLTIWFEHGLLGLFAYLIPALGLAVLAIRVYRRHCGLASALGGLAFMHIGAGLTNFNTIHNYYGIMLSLCILFSFWMAGPEFRDELASQAPARF